MLLLIPAVELQAVLAAQLEVLLLLPPHSLLFHHSVFEVPLFLLQSPNCGGGVGTGVTSVIVGCP